MDRPKPKKKPDRCPPWKNLRGRSCRNCLALANFVVAPRRTGKSLRDRQGNKGPVLFIDFCGVEKVSGTPGNGWEVPGVASYDDTALGPDPMSQIGPAPVWRLEYSKPICDTGGKFSIVCLGQA